MYYNNIDPSGPGRRTSDSSRNSPEYPEPTKKKAGTFTRSTTRANQIDANNLRTTLGQIFSENLLKHPEWSLLDCMKATYTTQNLDFPTDHAITRMMKSGFVDVAIGAPDDVTLQMLAAVLNSRGDWKKCSGMYGHLLRGPAGCGYREVMQSLFNAGKRAVDNSNGTLDYRQLTLDILFQNLDANDYAAKSILKNNATFRMPMEEWMRRVDSAEAGQIDGAHGFMSAEVTAPVVGRTDDQPLYVPSAKRRAADPDQRSPNILDEAFAVAFLDPSSDLDRSSRDGPDTSMPRPPEPPSLQLNHPVKQPSTRTSVAMDDGVNDSFGMYRAPFQHSSSTQSNAAQGMQRRPLQPADFGSNRVAQWVASHFGASGSSNQPVQTRGSAASSASDASDAIDREEAIRSIQDFLTSDLKLPGVTNRQSVLSGQGIQDASAAGSVDPDKEAAISQLMNEFMSGMPTNGAQPTAGQFAQFGFQGSSNGTPGLTVDIDADGNTYAMFFPQQNDADSELEALFQWHAEQQVPPLSPAPRNDLGPQSLQDGLSNR